MQGMRAVSRGGIFVGIDCKYFMEPMHLHRFAGGGSGRGDDFLEPQK